MARKAQKSSSRTASPKPLKHPEACPIKEDLSFQQITWIVERAGWLVMAAIVVAALAGLFGGPTTREDARDESGLLQVSYQHFQRHLNATDMKITVDTRGQSLFEVIVDRDLASSFEIRSIVPEPIETQAHDGGLLLKFAASPENKGPAQITIMAAPSHPGRVKGGIALLGESPARLDIFIYP